MQDSGIQVLFQGNNLLRILQGLGVTIGISILSVLLSMMFGTVMGIIMTSHSRIVRFLTRLYLEFYPYHAPAGATLHRLLWLSSKL